MSERGAEGQLARRAAGAVLPPAAPLPPTPTVRVAPRARAGGRGRSPSGALPRTPPVAWTTWLAIVLMAMFFVYVTVRGQLPAYLSLLFWTPVKTEGAPKPAPEKTHAAGLADVVSGAASPSDVLFGRQIAGEREPQPRRPLRDMILGTEGK
ncbi:MAG: hypothetical protein WC130_12545 [Kiritimatiellia bacterium]